MAEKPISLSELKTFLGEIKPQFDKVKKLEEGLDSITLSEEGHRFLKDVGNLNDELDPEFPTTIFRNVAECLNYLLKNKLDTKNGNVTIPGEVNLVGTVHAGSDVKVGGFDEYEHPSSETRSSLRINGTIENWGEVKHHGSVEVEQLKVSGGAGGSIVADGSVSAKDIKASGSIEAGGTMRAKGDLKTYKGLYPELDNSDKIGKADHRYKEAYITTVYGKVAGVSAAATKVVGAAASGHTAGMCDFLCDGTADQAEIQAAINALPASGGKAVLLEGTYSISGSININKPNVTIEGMGKGTVLTRAADNFTLLSINSDNVTVRDLNISGKRTVYTSGNNYGISGTRNHNNALIQNVTFDACAEGLRITQNNNIIINSCRFVKCTRAIYFDYVFTSAVVDNFVENCDQGIYIDWGSSKNIVKGNVLQISDGASGDRGIYLTASGEKAKYNIAANNSVFNYNFGIDIAGNYNKIVGNYVMRGSGQSSDYTASQYTIWCQGTYNDISDNYIPGKNYTNSGGSTNTFDNNRYQ